MKKARTKSGNSVPDLVGLGQTPIRRWYVVANRTEARAFESVDGKGFRPVMDLVHPEGALRERELNADRAGRTASSAAPDRRHALGNEHIAHEHRAIEFAKRIAMTLRKARTANSISELVLVAEPKFLGVLRNQLPKTVLSLVVHELGKEYPLMRDEELHRVLRGRFSSERSVPREKSAKNACVSVPTRVPLQIAFNGMSHSDAVEAQIREKALALEKHFPRLTCMRVVVGRSSKRHRNGNKYKIKVELTLPGGELAAAAERAEHEDIRIAVGNAFRASLRQLDDYVRARFRDSRRQDKKHARLTAETS